MRTKTNILTVLTSIGSTNSRDESSWSCSCLKEEKQKNNVKFVIQYQHIEINNPKSWIKILLQILKLDLIILQL